MPTPRRYATPAARQAAYRQRCAETRCREWAARGLPALPAIAHLPGQARWHGLIQHAALLLLTVQEEMEGYYEQRSETWQESERGETFLERLQAVQEAQAVTEELGR